MFKNQHNVANKQHEISTQINHHRQRQCDQEGHVVTATGIGEDDQRDRSNHQL
ncbi:Uncharacterised protein [Shigella sonnei]|nr:Uncharacterised protein [Shigella sonnei]